MLGNNWALLYADKEPLLDGDEEEDMVSKDITYMLNFTYEKSSFDIKTKAEIKAKELESKIAERQERIVKLREEYKITDAILVDLLTQARNAQKRGESKMSYTSSVRTTSAHNESPQELTIGAGVINNLLTESDFIDSEKVQLKKLYLVIRNLYDLPNDNISTYESAPNGEIPLRGHRLNYEELEYLGF